MKEGRKIKIKIENPAKYLLLRDPCGEKSVYPCIFRYVDSKSYLDLPRRSQKVENKKESFKKTEKKFSRIPYIHTYTHTDREKHANV